MILMTLLKGSMKNSKNLRERAQYHTPAQVIAETVTECDDELLTADIDLPSDSDILGEFWSDGSELKEEAVE